MCVAVDVSRMHGPAILRLVFFREQSLKQRHVRAGGRGGGVLWAGAGLRIAVAGDAVHGGTGPVDPALAHPR